MTDSPFARRLLPLVVDAVLVVLFAALGARTHHDGALTVAAVADVAWPFLGALGVAHAFVRLPLGLRAGLGIWLTTLVGGMLLRRAGGDGTATAFVVVAASFTFATLLGWRLVAWLVERRRAANPS